MSMPSISDIKEAFERWHADKFGWLNNETWPESGEYCDTLLQSRWESWQAVTEAAKATGTAGELMPSMPKHIYGDKHCFVQCPPERCDCKAGNPAAWAAQQATQPQPVAEQGELPKWIDDQKGKDPLMDDMIHHIEQLRAAIAASQQAAEPVALSDEQKRQIEKCLHDGAICGAISDSTLDAFRAVLFKEKT